MLLLTTGYNMLGFTLSYNLKQAVLYWHRVSGKRKEPEYTTIDFMALRI